jgi:hypothetical protein
MASSSATFRIGVLRPQNPITIYDFFLGNGARRLEALNGRKEESYGVVEKRLLFSRRHLC